MILVSNGYSSIFLGTFNTYSDYMEIIKFVQYIPYILLIPYLNPKSILVRFRSWLNFIIIWLVIVGFIQLLLVDPFLSYFISIYSIDIYHIEGLYGAHRIFVTGTDPNMGAAILFFFSIFIFMDKELFKSIFKLIVLVSLLFLFLNTQSRTSLLGAFLAYFMYNFFTLNHRFGFKVISSVLLGGCVFLFFNILDFDYIKKGFDLVRTGDNESLNLRIKYFYMAIYRFFESPIFGWGTAKSMHEKVIDSEYALIIQRYGLLGISVFTILYIKLFKNAINSYKTSLKATTVMFLFFSLVFMSTNNIFSGYQLMSIIILMYSLNYKSKFYA